MLLAGSADDAGADWKFNAALVMARGQGAKLWELRAATSLARLRREDGRQADARDVLAPIYGWFTEGFDTPDLKEARVLLKALNPWPALSLGVMGRGDSNRRNCICDMAMRDIQHDPTASRAACRPPKDTGRKGRIATVWPHYRGALNR